MPPGVKPEMRDSGFSRRRSRSKSRTGKGRRAAKVELERRPSRSQIRRGALAPQELSQIKLGSWAFSDARAWQSLAEFSPRKPTAPGTLPFALWAKRCWKLRAGEARKTPGGPPGNCKGADVPDLSAVDFAEVGSWEAGN